MDATSTDGRDGLTYGRFRAVHASRDARVYYGLDFDEKRDTALRRDDEDSREFFTNWAEEGRPPYSKRPLLYNRPAVRPQLS